MKKRALNFAIHAFLTSFCFSKSLNFKKFLDKLKEAKRKFIYFIFCTNLAIQMKIIARFSTPCEVFAN